MRVLRKLIGLTSAEWAELLDAQRELLVAQLRVWTKPRGRLVDPAALEDPVEHAQRSEFAVRGTADGADPRAVGPSPDHAIRAQRLALAVARAAEYGLFRPGCLVRATALHRILERRGVGGSRLRIGVRHRGDGFEAHSWVELDGRVLDDTEEHVRSFTHLTDVRVASPR